MLRIAICASLLLLFCSCKTSQGYGSIEELCKETLVALKSKDKATIELFMGKLLPDKGTAAYMTKHHCSYRRYPEGLQKEPQAIDRAQAELTDRFYSYALELDRHEVLNDLRFIGLERAWEPHTLCADILFEEPRALFVSDARQDTIKCDFGELLMVNGKLKLFADPKEW